MVALPAASGRAGGAERVRVAVVARSGDDWRAECLAQAALAHLCRIDCVLPVNPAAARRLVPLDPQARPEQVAAAGKRLLAHYVVVVEAMGTGEAAAKLLAVAASTHKPVTARAPLHELPGALALALAEAMGLKLPPAEREAVARPMVANEAAIEAVWRGDAAGEPARQLRCYSLAARQAPDSALVHSRVGTALARLNRHEEALAELDRAVSLQPDSPAAHTNRGLLLTQLKRWDEAEKALRQSIALGTKSPTPYVALARLLDRTGAAREAVELLEQAVELDPCHVPARLTLADWYFEAHDTRGAHRHVGGVLELEPSNVAALNLLGLLQLVARRSEEAEATLRKALAVDPNSAATHASLGCALFAQKRIREAIAAEERAIALDRTCAKAYLYLGLIHIDQQRYDDAIQALERAVEHAPDLLPARHALARARAARHRQRTGCGCLSRSGYPVRPADAALGALLPAVLLLPPHAFRLARAKRRKRR